jgi:hypothetical protein
MISNKKVPRTTVSLVINSVCDSVCESWSRVDEPIPERPRDRAGRLRLSEEKVREAREIHAQGDSINALARRYDVGWATMRNALSRKTWADVE